MSPEVEFLKWYMKKHHLEDYMVFRSTTNQLVKEASDLHLVATVESFHIKKLRIYKSEERKYLAVRGLTKDDLKQLQGWSIDIELKSSWNFL